MIDYVLDAVEGAGKIDRYIVIIDQNVVQYSNMLCNSEIEMVSNGEERLESFQNGIEYIKRHYSCDKLIVLDAVAPMVMPQIIDDYMDKLDIYDAVITAQHVTGGMTDKDSNALNRDDYIITQSPEAFRFSLLYDNYTKNTSVQEVACQLPKNAKRYYNFEFKENIKITYSEELNYVRYLLDVKANNANLLLDCNSNIDELYTSGIASFLLREMPDETNQWISNIWTILPDVMKKWEIQSFVQSKLLGLAWF